MPNLSVVTRVPGFFWGNGDRPDGLALVPGAILSLLLPTVIGACVEGVRRAKMRATLGDGRRRQARQVP